MKGDVKVSTPARPDFVQVLRVVAAGVAAQADFRVDAIEDLKLVVTEASAHLLAVAPTAEKLSMRLARVDGGLEVSMWTDLLPAGWPSPGADRTLSWTVISALADGLVADRVEGGAALRFRASAISQGWTPA